MCSCCRFIVRDDRLLCCSLLQILPVVAENNDDCQLLCSDDSTQMRPAVSSFMLSASLSITSMHSSDAETYNFHE